MNHTYLYRNEDDIFKAKGYSDGADANIEGLDITDDGKWVLII